MDIGFFCASASKLARNHRRPSEAGADVAIRNIAQDRHLQQSTSIDDHPGHPRSALCLSIGSFPINERTNFKTLIGERPTVAYGPLRRRAAAQQTFGYRTYRVGYRQAIR